MQTQLSDRFGNQYIIECFDLKKDYEEFIKINGKNIDFSKVITYEKLDETEVKKELACAGGTCQVV